MSDKLLHALRTFAALPEHVHKYIRDDWYRVMQTAECLRTGDGLVDGTIPRTLQEWGFEKRTANEYQAYHHMLFRYFLFGANAKVESSESRKAQRRSAS